MNRPSRNDDTEDHPDWNQSPHALSADLTTRADLNGIVNLREQHDNDSSLDNSDQDQINIRPIDTEEPPSTPNKTPGSVKVGPKTHDQQHSSDPGISAVQQPTTTFSRFTNLRNTNLRSPKGVWNRLVAILQKYAKFIGPGFLIAVAYIDPGNYATDVEAGAATRYRHLFVILLSNLFAIFLQSLCIKLGSVTGLDLAENCRKHLPRWLTLILYLLAESAIIATDIAEVSPGPMNRARVELTLTKCRSLVQP
jgi:metal iron transporter